MSDSRSTESTGTIGDRLHLLIAELYPLYRSITGNGVRETLNILARTVPLNIVEVPTGTTVFDWAVPKEWNIRDAYIKDPDGQKIVDFKRHNLHVVGYSAPVSKTLSLDELRPHLHTLPQHPEWIPYRTSYYKEDWGFCIPDELARQLHPGQYEVFIDASLKQGALSYGELYIPGDSEREVLIFSHVCHPSLCNDNLSGLAITNQLASEVHLRPRRLSYRFVWAPGTIGSICWLSKNENLVNRIEHGLVLVLLGDRGSMTYKRSRRGQAEIDQVVEYVLNHGDSSAKIIDFSPYGYDERQFCSPGFDLPVGRLTRTPNGGYPEYHTSADDLSFVTPQALEDSYTVCLKVLDILDRNTKFESLCQKCEPQLGKRGLYRNTGGQDPKERELAMLWVLNLSDGNHSLLEIARRSGLSFDTIWASAAELADVGLLRDCSR